MLVIFGAMHTSSVLDFIFSLLVCFCLLSQGLAMQYRCEHTINILINVFKLKIVLPPLRVLGYKQGYVLPRLTLFLNMQKYHIFYIKLKLLMHRRQYVISKKMGQRVKKSGFEKELLIILYLTKGLLSRMYTNQDEKSRQTNFRMRKIQSGILQTCSRCFSVWLCVCQIDSSGCVYTVRGLHCIQH